MVQAPRSGARRENLMSHFTASESSAPTSRYDSVAVHVAGDDEPNLLRVAVDIADRFKARLIGVGARRFELPPLLGLEATFVEAQIIQNLDALAEADLEAARLAFEAETTRLETEWRPARLAPADALSRAARDAELILASARAHDAFLRRRQADAADVVMSSGRPVIVAPKNEARLEARRIIVAWKDSREARRATSDALPFLQQAEEVLIQAVCEDGAGRAELEAEVSAVAANLARKRVNARGEVAISDMSPAEQLDIAAAALGADLIVAGAYGHSRASEWMFGGVTRALLYASRRFVLLSH